MSPRSSGSMASLPREARADRYRRAWSRRRSRQRWKQPLRPPCGTSVCFDKLMPAASAGTTLSMSCGRRATAGCRRSTRICLPPTESPACPGIRCAPPGICTRAASAPTICIGLWRCWRGSSAPAKCNFVPFGIKYCLCRHGETGWRNVPPARPVFLGGGGSRIQCGFFLKCSHK